MQHSVCPVHLVATLSVTASRGGSAVSRVRGRVRRPVFRAGIHRVLVGYCCVTRARVVCGLVVGTTR